MNIKENVSGLFFYSSEDDAPPQDFFSGIGIGAGIVYFGSEAMVEKPLSEVFDDLREGRFLACCVDKSTGYAYVKTDSFGAENIFLYKDDFENRWAVSNSLQHLADQVKKLNWQLDINEAAIAAMFVKGSLGQQLMSPQTPYQQIKMLDSDCVIKMGYKDNSFELVRLRQEDDVEDYESALLAWFNKWRSVLLSLANYLGKENPLIFDISGGVDSRMMLGLALNLPSDNVKFYTQGHKKDDLMVAEELCGYYGFDLSVSEPNWRRLPAVMQYELYLLGNTGVFSRPVTAPLNLCQSNQIKVSGVGGENYRKFYNKSGRYYADNIGKLLPNKLQKYSGEVGELLCSSFEHFDIDPDSSCGMIQHYRKLRSRIIGGRGFYENMKFTFLSPLFDFDLIRLSDSHGVSGNELYRDILILGGGQGKCMKNRSTTGLVALYQKDIMWSFSSFRSWMIRC